MDRITDLLYYVSWAALIVGSAFIVGALGVAMVPGMGHA